MLTSPDVPCKLATPPFAQSTGNCIDVPANDIARAACPFPMTTRPASGRFSVCSHSDCNTFTENLKKKKKHFETNRVRNDCLHFTCTYMELIYVGRTIFATLKCDVHIRYLQSTCIRNRIVCYVHVFYV